MPRESVVNPLEIQQHVVVYTGVMRSRNGVGIVVNHGGDGGIVVVAWRDKGVFGSLDPKILTTPSPSIN
ncbi:hypothetical protein Tco_1381802 [Tanacetum coccineum]